MDLEVRLFRQASRIYGNIFEDFLYFYVNTQPQNLMHFLLLTLHKACSLKMSERP